MADQGHDFEGYMDGMKQAEEEARRFAEMLDKHEAWRQNTFGGWLTRQLQALGSHFAPFFEAMAELMQKDSNSTSSVLFSAVMGALVIATYILGTYAIAQIVNSFIGKELVIEQEIVIEEEDNTITEGKERVEGTEKRRSAREKKER